MERALDFRSCVGSSLEKIGEKAIFAYCTNADLVVKIGLKEAEALSFIPGLHGCMVDGSGKEIVVGKEEYDRIVRSLPDGKLQIGGQAGNMALDASGLGVTGYLHTPNYSNRLLSLFKYNRVLVAGRGGFNPANESGDSSEPLVHLILEYKQGAGIRESNRFIVTYDEFNPNLYVHPRFSKSILREIPRIDRAFIAGFHLASEKAYARGGKKILAQVREWKRINPDLKIHLELGDFASQAVLRSVAREFFPVVDCVGLNENELLRVLSACGVNVPGFRGLAEVAMITKTVLCHTRDYSLAFSSEFGGKALSDSLGFASCAAALKAKTGKPPTVNELLRANFKAREVKPPRIDERLLGRKGIAAAFSPSAHIKQRISVGLGDCFSMAFFLSLKE